MPSPRISSLRSSTEDGQSSSATSRPQPRAMSLSQPLSGNPERRISAPTHALSGMSKPSPSFIAAHGGFHAPGSSTGGYGNHVCVGQVDIDDGPRGPKNPHGLSLDKSTGYFPSGSEAVPGTIEDLLRMIAAERLHHMPQKGSNWDRSIRILESFALKVSSFAGRYASVVDNVQSTATMIYGHCYSLLQPRCSQSTSFVPALGVLAGVSHALSLFAGCPRQALSTRLQQSLSQILERALDLLNGMTSYFQDLGISPDTVAGPAEFRHSLSKAIEAFSLQANQVLSELWNSHIPSDTQEPVVQFIQIQQLLQPRDAVTRTTLEIINVRRALRHEFTCEWFSKPFLDFVRGSDNAFWVDGRIGCGKTVLCGWVLESLQSPVDGKEYSTIIYTIDPLLPFETSTSCVVRALLRQLFEQQYGSDILYKALVKLVNAVTAGSVPVQVEDALWNCLQVAVSNIVQPTMLVIDGLSELDGGEAASAALFQNLLNVIAGNPLVRLFVLSRPFAFSASIPLRRKTIEARDTNKDIRRVILDLVPSNSAMPSVEILRRFDHEANGNFLWSLLTFQDWAAQDFSPQTWKTLPTTLDATVALLVSKIDLSNHLTRLVLFNSIIAVRPFRLAEMEILSRLDVTNKTLTSQVSYVTRTIEEDCGSVLVVQDGMVLFRHTLLKGALVDTLKFGTLSLGPDIHADLANRLLLYVALVLGQHSELTLKPTSWSAMEGLFHEHPLLSYALRYWTSHIVDSVMGNEPESFDSNSDCRHVFPDTVNAATIEASLWRRNLSHESLQTLKTAAWVRGEILGDHPATLETVACLAEALRCTKDFTGAAINFAVASQIAQKVLPEFHPFTATTMQKFLDVVELADGNEIQDLPSLQADVLRYLIRVYSHQFGASSDKALEFNHLLADHYASMNANLSLEVCQKVHQLTIDRYGRDSSQARATAERLVTVFSEEDSQQYSDSFYEDTILTYDVTDTRRIKASLAKAETYRSLEDPFNAEMVYISLWHGVAEACHRQESLENHEKLLSVGVLYADFLCQSGRLSEAQIVLLGLWSQQQASKYASGIKLEKVAVEMIHSGLKDMALDVLSTVLSFSEAQGPNAGRLQRVRKLISETTDDLVREAQGSSILSKSSEAALRRHGPSDVATSMILARHFANEDRFDDLNAVASEALNVLWPSIMDDSYDHSVHSTLDPFDLELAQLAIYLAQAYMKTNQKDRAGHMYWQLFQAARRSSAAVDDSTVFEYADLALTAFEQNGQIELSIALRQDLVDYCVKYGESHATTVEHRYALAFLYSQEQKFDNAKEVYAQIANSLRQPAFHEAAALPALRRLIDLYCRQKSWGQALDVYSSLWQTFLVRGRDYDFDSGASKTLYLGYVDLLKRQNPVDTHAPHEVTESYRSACLNLYGEHDPTTIEATLLLAESWDSEHSTEATRFFEWLVDTVYPREDTKEWLKAAENGLTDIYQAGINGDMDDRTITRALRLLETRYNREKTCHGSSHPRTLSSLTNWISMLTKKGSSHSSDTAVQELHLTIKDVLGQDLQPSSLYNAAVVLATSFSANNFIDEGLEIVRHLTEQVVFEQDRKANLLFLTAFEGHLTGSLEGTVGFAEVHAKVLMESALWESYKRLSQTNTEPAMTLACGARLRKFLLEHSSPDRGVWIENELFDRFLGFYPSAFVQSLETARNFFLVLLNELSSERLQIDIPRLACVALNKTVSSLLEDGKLEEALNISSPGFGFLRSVGAFANISNLEDGFQLALMLACIDVAPAPNETLAAQLLDLSKKILEEAFGQWRSRSFNISAVNMDLVFRIVSVLGLQQNFEDLEWLLTRLWLSRKSLTSLSHDVIVQIGRRLVEVRFIHGHVDSAIELGEDILYNLQRVYGTNHPSTIDMANFLSSMYVATGDGTAALVVTGDASQLRIPDVRGSTVKGNPPHPVDTVKSNLQYLLQFYQRNNDTNKSSEHPAAVVKESSEEHGHSNKAKGMVPGAQQAPVTRGIIDRGSDKRFSGIGQRKTLT